MADAGPRRPTSRDVAAVAGVSRTTVSFVLNNTPAQTIPDATRQAVLRAAEQLGYVPSANATALRSGRSRLVLLLVPPWARTEALSDFVRLTAEHLAGHGLVTVTHVSDTAPMRDLLAVISPAAVLSLAPLDPADQARLDRVHVPHVPAYVLDYPDHPHSMTLTQQRMGAAQAEHLIERGYDDLVYVEGPDVGHPARPDGRYDGARSAAAVARPGTPGVLRARYADQDGLDALVSAWAGAPGRTGVCAFDDLTALAVLARLRRHGVAVPGRVGVVGVDDITAGRLAAPPLTTVRPVMDLQARQLAARTAAVLGLGPGLGAGGRLGGDVPAHGTAGEGTSTTEDAAGEVTTVTVVARETT